MLHNCAVWHAKHNVPAGGHLVKKMLHLYNSYYHLAPGANGSRVNNNDTSDISLYHICNEQLDRNNAIVKGSSVCKPISNPPIPPMGQRLRSLWSLKTCKTLSKKLFSQCWGIKNTWQQACCLLSIKPLNSITPRSVWWVMHALKFQHVDSTSTTSCCPWIAFSLLLPNLVPGACIPPPVALAY